MLGDRPAVNACVVLACALGVIAWDPGKVLAQSTEKPETAAASGTTSSGDGGEEAFNNACRTCHSVKPGDNRLGPSLAGISGKEAGSVGGYAYSQSLKNSGVTFDDKTLDAFIANPDSVVPGNNMKPYTGITDAALRAKIIAHLKTK